MYEIYVLRENQSKEENVLNSILIWKKKKVGKKEDVRGLFFLFDGGEDVAGRL